MKLSRAANQFNDPPEPGNQFYMVNLEAKYLGLDSTSFFGKFSLKTVGQSAVVFTSFENSCGVIDDELSVFHRTVLPEGQSRDGNVGRYPPLTPIPCNYCWTRTLETPGFGFALR